MRPIRPWNLSKWLETGSERIEIHFERRKWGSNLFCNSPFELNHGRIAGWFWNRCGYWWIVSFSSWWWPADTSNEDRSSMSCLGCFFSFFRSFTSMEVSRGDCESLVIGLVGDGLCFLLVDVSVLVSSLSQLKFSFFISISSSSSIFDLSSLSFDSFCCFFCCFSLLSSRISQMWKPEVGFVDVGSFMLSRNLWIEMFD